MLNKTICLVFLYPETLRDHQALDNLQAWTSLIIVIYTTMSPILLIFGPKVPPQVVFKNPKKFWPRTPRGPDMAIWNFQNLGVP